LKVIPAKAGTSLMGLPIIQDCDGRRVLLKQAGSLPAQGRQIAEICM